ncbi:adhesion G protein-coupled receptor E3-like isoform X2 [Pelodiscus sinensis]|uniref:adhesion G protein-coupled receptor E3-like isoform X2 n=1 Tax=Pelodiscus sinensis TaxID=13735 RepID=UPI003F6C4213
MWSGQGASPVTCPNTATLLFLIRQLVRASPVFLLVVLVPCLSPGSTQGASEICPDLICPSNTTCVNSTHCACLEGFLSRGGRFFTDSLETCDDIDECLRPNPVNCGPDATCNNVPGSFYCTCADGYESSSGKARFPNASENSCRDIDECLGPNPVNCGPNATCNNLPGSFYCTCTDGYKSSSGKARFRNASENSCWVPSMNCSTKFEGITETCRSRSPQGELRSSSGFCSFLNSTLRVLKSECGEGNVTLSLEETTRSFNSFLNRTSLGSSRCEGEVASAVTLLLQSVERVALAAALRSPGQATQNMRTESMAIETRVISENCSQHSEAFRLSSDGETMEVHCTTVTHAATQAHLGAAAFIAYSSLHSIFNERLFSSGCLSAGGMLEKSHLGSRVVSGAVGDGGPICLSRPANFTLRHQQPRKEQEVALCVYWKFEAGKGSWSPDGCTTLHVNSTHTTCSCDHLSSFAILMAPTAVTESRPLNILIYVGLSLSLLCLLLTILTFLLCRSIWNVSTALHLQLCLCLFLADLLVLSSQWVSPISNQSHSSCSVPEVSVACAVIAGLLHYLFLACFTWMLLEGLHLFLTARTLKEVYYTSIRRFKKRHMYPFGYGFPALIVAISAAVNPKGYGTSEHCWLSLDRGFRWSFLGPVCVIILINVTFFALTLWILRSSLSSLNADVSSHRGHRLMIFKTIVQLFVLGCTWILGLLQVGPAATLMAYWFNIINSLQGAFIFLVHCLLNRQVREEYRRWIRGFRPPHKKSQTDDLSMSTVPTTGTKAVLNQVLPISQNQT